MGQWRRSVVKSEWSGSVRSSHQTRSRPIFVFVFGAENELFGHFRLFSFSAENEKCIFGRPLHQSISDYTLRQWFSNTQQSRFLTTCRCPEKLVYPTFWHKSYIHHHHRRRRRLYDDDDDDDDDDVAYSERTLAPLHDPWRSQIYTA